VCKMMAVLQAPDTQTSTERVIDIAHLSRQTMGDRALEAEILTMFAKQLSSARAAFAAASVEERKRLAHTIKGTARSVGAFSIADVAERIEKAPLNASLISDIGTQIARALDFINAINR